jgi:hypothetical protein
MARLVVLDLFCQVVGFFVSSAAAMLEFVAHDCCRKAVPYPMSFKNSKMGRMVAATKA